MKRSGQSPSSNPVIWLVLEYLCANPDAKDTAEGIINWWVGGRGVKIDRGDVKIAQPTFLEHREIVSNVPLRRTPAAIMPQAKSVHPSS